MKYITLIIGLLVMGCGTPVKEATLEEKIIGEYEAKFGEDTTRAVFLENGNVEWYINGFHTLPQGKWKIVDGEIHVTDIRGTSDVVRINKDGSITYIASIDKDGKREDTPKEDQGTLKKIK